MLHAPLAVRPNNVSHKFKRMRCFAGPVFETKQHMIFLRRHILIYAWFLQMCTELLSQNRPSYSFPAGLKAGPQIGCTPKASCGNTRSWEGGSQILRRALQKVFRRVLVTAQGLPFEEPSMVLRFIQKFSAIASFFSGNS